MNRVFKILAINGSHRSQRGISEILLQKFLSGAKAAGADCTVIYPSKMKIFPCRACHKCILETPGRCFYQDDMASVIEKMEEADLMVWAAPVYFDTAPSNMQKMFERLMPMLGPVFEYRNGRTYHLPRSGKKHNVVSILLCGNPERESLACLSKSFRRIATNMGGCLKGEFLFPSSYLVAAHPQRVAKQLDALNSAGKEIASNNRVSKETLSGANQAYIDDPVAIIEEKNRYFQGGKL